MQHAVAESGSGMRLVRALAGQLGGRLELRAAEVGGTLLVVCFPVVVPARAMPAHDVSEAPHEVGRRAQFR